MKKWTNRILLAAYLAGIVILAITLVSVRFRLDVIAERLA